jgi:hypothetical protein
MKTLKVRTAAAIGAVILASGLGLAGTASAAPTPALASSNLVAGVVGDTSNAAVATPSGSFHIPVVPFPFSGSLTTTFDLYALPVIPAGTIGYEVFLSTPGDEQQYNPDPGTTIILNSDSQGPLIVPVNPGQTTLGSDPIPDVDFNTSGLAGFVTAAGNYSLGIKFFGNTSLTGTWWTTIHFNGAVTTTNSPSWQWEPAVSP